MSPLGRGFVALVLTALVWMPAGPRPAVAATGDVRETARDAFIYGYPLVLMEVTRRMTTIGRANGQFAHMLSGPTPPFRIVVAPNGDTRYSSAWLDVSAEPLVLHVPDAGGRYFVAEVMDAWTDVIADPTTRVPNSAPKDYAIAGPGWHGTVPAGVSLVRSPTNDVWVLARTRAKPGDDAAAISAVQQQYRVVPLSRYGDASYQPPPGVLVDPSFDTGPTPVSRVTAMDDQTFFSLLATALVRDPPLPADAAIVAHLASIGVVAGKPFDPAMLDVQRRAQLDAGMHDALARIEGYDSPALPHVDGWRWTKDTGRFGTAYLYRAFIADTLLAANLPEDAVYLEAPVDGGGAPLSGSRRYTIHFDAARLPPVDAFWSLTLYGPDHFFVANPVDRYTLRDTNLVRNADGSIDVTISHDAPAGDTRNWLPAPSGPFVVTLRMYWPRASAIDGSYRVPPIVPLP